MAEADMWRKLDAAFKGNFYDFQRVENAVGPGTPDVSYSMKVATEDRGMGRFTYAHTEGWIELKEMKQFPPERTSTIFRVPHYTPQQRIWLMRRDRAGGNVWILLRVVNPMTLWLLVPGPFVGLFGDVPAKRLMELSAVVSIGKEFPKALVEEALLNGSAYYKSKLSPANDPG